MLVAVVPLGRVLPIGQADLSTGSRGDVGRARAPMIHLVAQPMLLYA